MSVSLFSRLPSNLVHIFQIYMFLAKKFLRIRNFEADHHIQITAPSDSIQVLRYMNRDINDNQIRVNSNFPRVIAKAIGPIFEEATCRGERQLTLHRDSHNSAILSSKNHTHKNFTDYQARVLSSFASSLNPYTRLPNSLSYQSSFRWYHNLLSTAPIIIFLRQKQRLMSESSLLSQNPSFENLRTKVLSTSSRYLNSLDILKRHRNYHLSDMVSSDIFNLALQNTSPDAFQSPDSHENPSPKDRLYRTILNSQYPEVINTLGDDSNDIGATSVKQISPLRDLEDRLSAAIEPKDVSSVIPYDVHYNDIYLLSIEAPIIEDDHSDVLKQISSEPEFEVFAVRVSADLPAMNVMKDNVASGEIRDSFRANYAELLSWAMKQHQSAELHESGLHHLYRTFGLWGLVEVSETSQKNAFYLFK